MDRFVPNLSPRPRERIVLKRIRDARERSGARDSPGNPFSDRLLENIPSTINEFGTPRRTKNSRKKKFPFEPKDPKRKPNHVFPDKPYKALEVHNIVEDFYYDLVDWSQNNRIAIGIRNEVYQFNPDNDSVDIITASPRFSEVTSVSWNPDMATHLAYGNGSGRASVVDAETKRATFSELLGRGRIGNIKWRDKNLMALASSSSSVYIYDINSDKDGALVNLRAHEDEVCGLAWSRFDGGTYLATGGNDNRVYVWDFRDLSRPLARIKALGAVKALSWSPNENLLALGTGSHDTRIIVCNPSRTSSAVGASRSISPDMEIVSSVRSGNQITNIHWSSVDDFIIATQGYNDNSIAIWTKQLNLAKTIKTAHTPRILYFAASPDETRIVTGSAKNLFLWKLFDGSQKKDAMPIGLGSPGVVLSGSNPLARRKRRKRRQMDDSWL